MQQLFQRTVLLVTGKGGVGKSTVAAALARRASADGKRVLLIEFESVSRVAPLFGRKEAPIEPAEVAPGLDLMAFDLLHALHHFAGDQLKVRALARLALANRHVRGFFLAMPAIKSILFLYQLQSLEAKHGPRGDRRWDLIICDMPTSGFVAGLYGVPAMVRQIFRVGPLAATAEAMGALIFDPMRTGLVLVTLPEEMPVVETLELRNALRAKHGVETAAIVVNGIYPEILQSDEMAALSAAVGDAGGLGETDAGVAGVMWAAHVLRARAQRAAQLLPSLRDAQGGGVIELPHLFRRHLPLDAIDDLATRMRRTPPQRPAPHTPA
jgi:anion-transporting  ArsA/GET3 family ATPase